MYTHYFMGKGDMLREICKLRTLLHQMETESDLAALTAYQRDVLYAAVDVAGSDGHALLKDIVAHALVKDIPRPTYFRAIKCLIQLGRLERVGLERSGVYKVVSS